MRVQAQSLAISLKLSLVMMVNDCAFSVEISKHLHAVSEPARVLRP